MPDEQTPWVVKGVPERTRRQIKTLAAKYDVTMAQALELLVDSALRDDFDMTGRINHAARYYYQTENRWPAHSESIRLLAMIAEIEQSDRDGMPINTFDLNIPALVRLGLLDASSSTAKSTKQASE